MGKTHKRKRVLKKRVLKKRTIKKSKKNTRRKQVRRNFSKKGGGPFWNKKAKQPSEEPSLAAQFSKVDDTQSELDERKESFLIEQERIRRKAEEEKKKIDEKKERIENRTKAEQYYGRFGYDDDGWEGFFYWVIKDLTINDKNEACYERFEVFERNTNTDGSNEYIGIIWSREIKRQIQEKIENKEGERECSSLDKMLEWGLVDDSFPEKSSSPSRYSNMMLVPNKTGHGWGYVTKNY